jgi:hypothetical protein
MGICFGIVGTTILVYYGNCKSSGGVLLVNFVYTISWCFGIYEWFFRNKEIK